MKDEIPTVTSMTRRIEEDDDSIGSKNSNATQGNVINEAAINLGANKETMTHFDSKKIDEFHTNMYWACKSQNWERIENFLSDKSISNQEKRMVFQKDNSRCCRSALTHGAPCHIIKGIIELMDPKSPQFLTFDSDWSWLHLALGLTKPQPLTIAVIMSGMFVRMSRDIIELLVSIGGKRLVNMQSRKQSRTSLQLYLLVEQEEEHCPKIIKSLLETGGLELLEIEDEDGYSVRDFSNESQREIIIDYLKSLKECPRVQKHIEAFEAVDVTPKEFYDWIKNEEFDQVRSYLDDEKVSINAKMKCINVQTGSNDRPFHSLCGDHGPIDIAKKIIDIMGKDFLFLKDDDGNNCLHNACDYVSYDGDDDDYVPTDVDVEVYCDFVAFLLSRGGWKLLLEANDRGDTALYYLMRCKLTNLECVKLVVKTGGYDLLAFQDEEVPDWTSGGNTILHYASLRNQPDREVIKYLVTVGGPRLTEIKNKSGSRAEDRWSTELKEYIAFSTNTLPALSDDLQCPICFDTLFDVHVISKCCHRFCKNCITQSYEKRGNTCPVCRAEFSIGDVKKDPLLCKLAFAVKEEKDAKKMLQLQLIESQKKVIHLLKKENKQLQSALKRKRDEL